MGNITQERTNVANVDHKHWWNRTTKPDAGLWNAIIDWTAANVKKMVHHRRTELRMNARYAGVKLGNPEQSNRIEIEKNFMEMRKIHHQRKFGLETCELLSLTHEREQWRRVEKSRVG